MIMKAMLFSLILLLAVSSIDARQNHLSDIHEAANKYDCTPLGNDSNINKLMTSWWTDISSLTGRKGDLVFLCRWKPEPDVFRIVITADMNRNIWNGCPSFIDIYGVYPYPSGLAVLKSDNPGYLKFELSNWYYEDGTKGPIKIMPTKPVIDTSDQVAGGLYYCHEGKWLRIHVH
jgi:hypothetical protein